MIRKLLLFTAVSLLFSIFMYFFTWEGKWKVVRGAEKVQRVAIDKIRLASPTLHWLDEEKKLVLEGPSYQTAPGEGHVVQVIDGVSRQISWVSAEKIDLRNAISVKWNLERIIEQAGRQTFLYAFPDKNGPVAELTFSGITISYPGLVSNWPFGGNIHWEMIPRYFGRLRISVRENPSAPETMQLQKSLFNTTYIPKFRNIAAWTPEGDYLILDIHYPDRENSVYLLGAFSVKQSMLQIPSTDLSQTCSSDDQCPSGHFCDISWECPKGYALDRCKETGTKTCIKECTQDNDCAPELSCQNITIWKGDAGISKRGCLSRQTDPKTICVQHGRKWLEEYQECEGMTKQECEQSSGVYDSCASACRHDPNYPNVACIESCVAVCKFF